MVIRDNGRDVLVLDTKWKLLDSSKTNGSDKYGLSEADLYQLHAYGQSYLHGRGDVVLVYPRTDSFDQPLPVFDFAAIQGLRLWVLPFCMRTRTVIAPAEAPFAEALLSRWSPTRARHAHS